MTCDTLLMSDTSLDLQPYPMTVVIASLGGCSLKNTIESLNRGTIVPYEILVCIPLNKTLNVQNLSFPNVKIFATDCRGQVSQRAIGFQNAAHDIVMQIDDDILVDKYCIERLLETLKTCNAKVAVAPSLVSLSTGKSIYKRSKHNRTLLNLYYWLMNGSDGYQPGRIDRSGSAIGIDPESEDGVLFDVEWLAGGCVMHFRENLVLKNFYPFEGKAYFEDVIHSYYLRNKGISLIVDTRACVWLDTPPSSSYGHSIFLKQLMSDFQARRYVMQLYSRRSIRIYFYYFASYLSYLYKKIIKFNVPKDYRTTVIKVDSGNKE